MKVIQNNFYDIWYELTDRLLEAKGISKEDFREDGKKVWGILMECSERIDIGPKAFAAFWAAWGNCMVTYEHLAELLTKEPDRWRWKWKSKPVTENQVKWLLNDARDKIKKDANTEIDEIISSLKNER
jgi:hypothetical protein